jgi:hypothetical protein
MPDVKQIPEKRFLTPRPDRSDAAKTSDALNSLPPLITLIRSLQAGHSSNPIQRTLTEIGGAELSRKTGVKKVIGRTLAEGPVQHDLGLTALKTLSPNVSPMYRTNKVGEMLTLGLGNFVKDQAQDAIVGKFVGGSANPAGKKISKAVADKIEKGMPYANLLSDPYMYQAMTKLAGYLQKPRSELGGKSVYQSIPGFEDYLTQLASKDIANKPIVKHSKLLNDPAEHKKTLPYFDETTLAFLKQFLPKYAPPMEADNEGRIMPKYDAYQNRPAINGDYNYEELGLTEDQETGWDLIKLAKALEWYQEDFAKTRPAQAMAEMSTDLSPLNILKVLKKHGKEALFNTINPTPTFNPDKGSFNTRTSIPLQ